MRRMKDGAAGSVRVRSARTDFDTDPKGVRSLLRV